jgi:hypothetical protein
LPKKNKNKIKKHVEASFWKLCFDHGHISKHSHPQVVF